MTFNVGDYVMIKTTGPAAIRGEAIVIRVHTTAVEVSMQGYVYNVFTDAGAVTVLQPATPARQPTPRKK